MTIEEVKAKIEANINLIGTLVSEEIDLTKGNYTRLKLEYTVPVNPTEATIATFIAHGIDGDYTVDKNYDFIINSFKGLDFRSDSADYLDGLITSREIVTWTELISDVDNPEMAYTKVYVDEGGISTPKPWLLVREGEEGVAHSLTTWDQFPILEE